MERGQTFGMPLPTGILGPLWGEQDICYLDVNLERSALQRDPVVHDLDISVALSLRVWNFELVFCVPCILILIVFLFA